MNCVGLALGLLCVGISSGSNTGAAPTGKAPFCEVMQRAVQGGKLRPSRQDSRSTKEDADAVNAAYDSLCAKKAQP